MATRSTIGKRNSDGSLTYIYCHWDGYLSNNGKILLQHYSNIDRVNSLLSLGSLSSLGPTPAECEAYHRDRGDKLMIKNAHTPEEFEGEEFNYVWDTDHWKVAEGPYNIFGMPAKDQTIHEGIALTLEMCE